jgi:hypothetical protein
VSDTTNHKLTTTATTGTPEPFNVGKLMEVARLAAEASRCLPEEIVVLPEEMARLPKDELERQFGERRIFQQAPTASKMCAGGIAAHVSL